MGLFFGRKKKTAQQPKHSLIPVEITISFNDDAEEEKDEELAYWSQEGMRIRREKIENLGVDTSLFTPGQAFQDAMGLVYEFAPTHTRLGYTFSQSNMTVDFQNLTKTGKLPKNVCKASLTSNKSDAGSAAIYLSYLKNAAINMADVSFSANMKAFSFSVRIVDGDYRVTYIGASNWLTNVDDTLYLEKKPASNDEQLQIIAQQIQWISRKQRVPK